MAPGALHHKNGNNAMYNPTEYRNDLAESQNPNVRPEHRQNVWLQAQHILDTAEKHSRDMSAGEKAKYEGLNAELDRIDAATARKFAPSIVPARVGHGDGRGTTEDQAVDGLREMLLENSPRPVIASGESARTNYQPGVERRDLLTSAPGSFSRVSFHDQIIASIVDGSAILAAGATLLVTPTGEPLRIPRATASSTATLTAEAAAFTESDPALGVVTLGAAKYGALIQVSRELIEDSGTDLQAYLAAQAGEAIGRAIGSVFVTAAIAAASVGVTGPTGTATSFGSQATAGQGTDLLNSLYASVAEPYTRSKAAGFLARNATISAIRNLKTSDGTLVGSSYLAASPAPFHADAFVPALGASSKSILFGDWGRFFVRMVQGIRFDRSDDYAFNQDLVTFRASVRVDGNLVDAAAVRWFANSAT